MHRSHPLRWLALAIAVSSFQCLQSLSDDCRKTRTCEVAPQLGADCLWHYPDGGIWTDGPRKNQNEVWVWPDGTLTQTQKLECGPDAGVLGDGGLEPVSADNCPAIACDMGLMCDEASHRCVKCLDSSQCAEASDPNRGPTHACDPHIHDCVVCVSDTDCGTLRCKTDPDPTKNRCVECTSPTQCNGADVCDLVGSNQCTSTCTGPGQCKPPKGVCSDPMGGLCVGCIGNNDCSGATTQCNTARKECVQCVDNTPCTSATAPVCSPGNRCVECVDNSTCRDENKRNCDPVTNSCVACLDSSQCTARDKSRCNALHECAPCTDNTQCEADAPFCSGGRCVVCIDNSTCGTLKCDIPTGSCVGCLSNDDCNQDSSQARCNVPLTTCEPCTASTQCAGKFGIKNLCSSNGECVQCTGNLECAADATKARCDGTGLCAGCQTNGDCSAVTGKHACTGANNGGRCVECLANADCNGNAKGPACNTTTNTCAQCVVDTDCKSTGASRCVSNQCVPCTDDSQCTHILNGQKTLGVCDTSVANAGVCVECTGPKRAACGANVCNSLQKVCSAFLPGDAGVCQDCVSDAHCAAGNQCVPETFGGANLGYSCFPIKPAGNCPGFPYLTPTNLISSDGIAVDVCLPRKTTCAGVNQAKSATPCTVDGDCGEAGLADGVCDTTMLNGLCSLPCSTPTDCLGPSSTCSGVLCQ